MRRCSRKKKERKKGRGWSEKRKSDTIKEKRLAAARKEALTKHASRKEGRSSTIRGKRLAVIWEEALTKHAFRKEGRGSTKWEKDRQPHQGKHEHFGARKEVGFFYR